MKGTTEIERENESVGKLIIRDVLHYDTTMLTDESGRI